MELKLLAVAVGGAVGACTRYWVSQWAAGRFGADFPYGTLIVNVVGCFIIGVFLTLTTERLIVSPYWRLIVAVGFLGGLTMIPPLAMKRCGWSMRRIYCRRSAMSR